MARYLGLASILLVVSGCGVLADESGSSGSYRCPIDRDIGRNAEPSLMLAEEMESKDFEVQAEEDIAVDNIYTVLVKEEAGAIDALAMGEFDPGYITQTYGIGVEKAVCSKSSIQDAFADFVTMTDGSAATGNIEDPGGLCSKLGLLKDYENHQVISVIFLTLDDVPDIGTGFGLNLADAVDVRKFFNLNMRDSRYFDVSQLHFVGEEAAHAGWTEAQNYTGGQAIELGASFESILDQVVTSARRGVQHLFPLEGFAAATAGEVAVELNGVALVHEQDFVVTDQGFVRVLHSVNLAPGDTVKVSVTVFYGDDPADLPGDDVGDDGEMSAEDC